MSLETTQELKASLGTAIFSFAGQFCLCISIPTAYLLYFPQEPHATFKLEDTNILERVKWLKVELQIASEYCNFKGLRAVLYIYSF